MPDVPVVPPVVIAAPAPPQAGATGGGIARPRPPEIAEREEFDAASARGTAQALELFLARHPKSRWRQQALDQLEALRASGRPR